MSEYISPTLGIIPEEIVSLVSDAPLIGFSSFKTRMLVEQGYGVLRSGILYSEHYLDGSRLGSDLYDKLVDFGFSYSDSLSIIRIFAADNMLQRDLVDLGFDIDSIVYGLDLPGRLKALGLVSRTVTSRYALESIVTVYPLREIVPPPPPPEVCYRTQLAYLYTAKTIKKPKTPEIVAEFRVWGSSNIKGKYQIKYFERVILHLERIMKGEGMKPKNWLASIEKTIKASEEDEEIDCDEVDELDYASRGVAFRDEWGEELAVEYDEKWIKSKEKKMIEEGKLKCLFDNRRGFLIYPDGTPCVKEEQK